MTDPGTGFYTQYLLGDGRALEQLVALFSDMLVRFACRITNDPAAAEDLAEDAFVEDLQEGGENGTVGFFDFV